MSVIQSPVLVLFCRRPAPGVGKQRLAATMGPDDAAVVARLLLAAALEDLRAWPHHRVIAPAEAQDAGWAANLAADCDVLPQGSGNLGQRLAAVDAQLRQRGAHQVLFIGSDAPALTPDQLLAAERALESHDAVLIPARDGGVTLLGARRPWPELANLPWETPLLCQALAARCMDAGLSCARLESSFDIDTLADLRFAGQQLADDPRPARQQLCQWIHAHRSVSVVIPVLHDFKALRRLVSQLQRDPAPPDEIIVVAADTDPRYQQLATHLGLRCITSAACRGAQLRAGAMEASGEILWFLHADSQPPVNAVARIRTHIAAGHRGGYFRFRFRGPRTQWSRLLQAAINLRTRIGVPYGDQGLFARRDDYVAAGCHDATPLFEEVRLIKALRRQGKFGPLAEAIGVSSRRWRLNGWVRQSLRNRLLALGFMLGIPAERLALWYNPAQQPATMQQPGPPAGGRPLAAGGTDG